MILIIRHVVQLHVEDQIKVAVMLVGAEKRVRATFLGLADDDGIFHPISRRAISLRPPLESLAVENGFVRLVLRNKCDS